jgi:hypothetical protein
LAEGGALQRAGRFASVQKTWRQLEHVRCGELLMRIKAS